MSVGALTTELDRQRRRFGGLLAELPDRVFVVDDDGMILEDFHGDPTGHGPQVGRLDTDLVTDMSIDEVVAARAEWVRDGRTEFVAIHVDPQSGERQPFETRVRRIGPSRAVAVARSIRERRDAVQERRRLHRRWRQLLEAAREGIAELDHEGVVIDANEALAGALGHTSTSLLGAQLAALIEPGQWPDRNDDLRRIRTGERIDVHVEVEGVERTVAVVPRLDPDGVFSGALVVVSEVPRAAPGPPR